MRLKAARFTKNARLVAALAGALALGGCASGDATEIAVDDGTVAEVLPEPVAENFPEPVLGSDGRPVGWPSQEELRLRDEAVFAQLKRDDDLIKARYTHDEQLEILARAGMQLEAIDPDWNPGSESLSADERTWLEGALAGQGIQKERIAYAGRSVIVDGDGYIDADTLLDSGLETTEKGRVLSAILAYETGSLPRPLRRSGTFADGSIITPMLFAQINMNNNGLLFKRPFIVEPLLPQRVYYLVYQDNFRQGSGQPAQPFPQEVVAMLRDAAFGVSNAVANDCLYTNPIGPALFNVISRSEWLSLSAINRAFHIRIRVVYGPMDTNPGASPSPLCMDDQGATCEVIYSCNHTPGSQACAVFPRNLTRSTRAINGDVTGSVTRVVFGTHLGIISDSAASGSVFAQGPTGLGNTNVTRQARVRLLMHEIGHLIGLSHPNENPANSIVVPGTSAAPSQSIMYSGVHPEPNGPSDTITSDDYMTLKTLYSRNRPEACGYVEGFQSVSPLVCPIGSIQNQDSCCPASCGACGGGGCSGRPGGSTNCCYGGIVGIGRYCTNNSPPCELL